MARKLIYNPISNQFDFVDDNSSTAGDNVVIKRTITTDFIIQDGYTMLGRDTVIDSGVTLTIDTNGEFFIL